MKSKQQLVLIRGLPGSGKSTLAESMAGYVHIEADQFFMYRGKYEFDPSKVKQAHAWCLRKVKTTLARSDFPSVVVANTFTQNWEMQPYFDMVIALDQNIRFSVITALGEFKSIHNVPEDTLQRMRDRWENLRLVC